MEKQLAALGFYLGLLSTILALLFRFFAAFNILQLHMGLTGGSAFSYMTFLRGAELFFVLSIASWLRTPKP